MDKNRISGAADKVKGSIKQGLGEVTGDANLEAEGRGDKAKGKVEGAVGNLKDGLRDAVDGKDRV